MGWVSKPPIGTPLDPGNRRNHGLIGFWPMWEGAGRAVADISGLGNHATMVGMEPPSRTSSWVGGCFGSALRFDGSDGLLLPLLSMPDAWSVSMYVCFPAAPSGASLFGEFAETTADTKNYIQAASGSSLLLDQFSPSGGSAVISTTLPLNTWVHIVAVQTAANARSIWLNNSHVATSTETYTGAAPTKAAIGVRYNSGTPTQYLNGLISHVKVWGRAITREERWLEQAAPFDVFAASRRKLLYVAASGDVTVNLTGVGASGSAGAVDKAVALTASGVAGTSGVGTPTESVAYAVSGVSGSTGVGNTAHGIAGTIVGVGATASPGGVTPSIALTLLGIEGIAFAGSPTVNAGGNATVNMVGVAATSGAGAPAPAIAAAAVGVAGNAAAAGASVTVVIVTTQAGSGKSRRQRREEKWRRDRPGHKLYDAPQRIAESKRPAPPKPQRKPETTRPSDDRQAPTPPAPVSLAQLEQVFGPAQLPAPAEASADDAIAWLLLMENA